MSFDVSDDPVDFDEAIAWFRRQLALTSDDLDALTDDAKSRAFTIAGVAQLDIVTHVYDALKSALENGDDFETFRTSVSDSLERAWGGTDPSRIETIFRTNVQKAYGHGRFKQAREVAEDRPVWMFDAVLDSRTTDVCEECQDTVLPADDPWWQDHLPPLHFNCRSTFITLTDEQAKAFGVDTKGPAVDADDGFGDAPADDDDAWEPDADDYPDDLWKIFRSLST